jgi:hypothetical protein
LNTLTLKLITLIPLDTGMALLGSLYNFPHSLKPMRNEKMNKKRGHFNLKTQKTRKNILINTIKGTIKFKKGY